MEKLSFSIVSRRRGWISLIAAITAVEHGGHHPPTQDIYICGFVYDSQNKKKVPALWLRGEEEEECEMWSALAERGEDNSVESKQA